MISQMHELVDKIRLIEIIGDRTQLFVGCQTLTVNKQHIVELIYYDNTLNGDYVVLNDYNIIIMIIFIWLLHVSNLM